MTDGAFAAGGGAVSALSDPEMVLGVVPTGAAADGGEVGGTGSVVRGMLVVGAGVPMPKSPRGEIGGTVVGVVVVLCGAVVLGAVVVGADVVWPGPMPM